MKVRIHPRRPRGQQGLVTVIVLALIILLAVYVEANMRVLSALKGQIQLIDKTRTVSEPADGESQP